MASYAVSDASDQSADPHLWARGFFGTLSIGDGEPHPHHGPAFGDGADVPMSAARGVGEDNYYVMSSIGGLSDEEIAGASGRRSTGAHALSARRRSSMRPGWSEANCRAWTHGTIAGARWRHDEARS